MKRQSAGVPEERNCHGEPCLLGVRTREALGETRKSQKTGGDSERRREHALGKGNDRCKGPVARAGVEEESGAGRGLSMLVWTTGRVCPQLRVRGAGGFIERRETTRLDSLKGCSLCQGKRQGRGSCRSHSYQEALHSVRTEA
jgi:hypothetical protein